MRPGHPALRLIERVDRVWDAAIEGWHRRFGYGQPIHIVPYNGYGTIRELILEGRVLADRGIHQGEERTPWINFVDMMKRYASYEIPGAQLTAEFEGQTYEALTDKEGFYRLLITPENLPDQLWHEVKFTLRAPLGKNQDEFTVMGRAQVPASGAQFGVISDIDDTIVRTGATNLLTHARIVLFNSAHSRLPFAGVASFYQALQQDKNPIWYVSSSPWNIYDLITEFMNVRGIPAGTLLMKDFGIDSDKFIKTSHRVHKLGWIQRLVETYPHLPFILIGDTGQADAEIYRSAVETNPGRIAAVYLRDVGQTKHRASALENVERIRERGVDAVLIANTVEAAEHAASRGFIDPAEVDHVRADRIRERPSAASTDEGNNPTFPADTQEHGAGSNSGRPT